jgi:hypothetical protein
MIKLENVMNPKRILIIDDADQRHQSITANHVNDKVTSVYHCDTACQLVLQGDWDIIYLDHDAGFVKPYFDNYRPVACVIAAIDIAQSFHTHPEDRVEVRVHSSNPDGATWLVNFLKSHGVNAGFVNPYHEIPKERYVLRDSFDESRAWQL